MNHEKIYNELLELVERHCPVYTFNHIALDDKFYRVFFYNNSSYKLFLEPSALECRGITFEVSESGDFIKLVSLPMPKFFNYKENPFTQGIDEKTIDVAMFKEDGSLVSSFIHNDKAYLKSKGHLFSEQANAATKLLHENIELLDIVMAFESSDCTVNLEYTSPDNLIVLNYQEPALTILNVRNRVTGKYIPYNELKNMNKVAHFLVSHYSEYEGMTLDEFSKIVKATEDIEGYVVLVDKQWIKLKTDWYCHRHNTIDSFNPYTKKGRRSIAEAIINETIDDAKQLLENNKLFLRIITEAEEFISEYIESADNMLNHVKESLSELERKEVYPKVNALVKDSILANYIMKRLFEEESSAETLITFIKNAIHSSKFKAYNDFIEKSCKKKS